MNKKINFTDQPTKVKVIYSAVIAVLCVTAIVIGIVSAASKKNAPPADNNPPITDNGGTDKLPETDEKEDVEDKLPEKLTFVAPVVGKVMKGHSLDVPVFSDTLNEWRVHSGIDISAAEGSQVYAVADGTVTKVFSDPFLGRTVEVTHTGGVISIYSNLSASDIAVSVGDNVRSGDRIGLVGDTSLSELADEPHLHFGVRVDGVGVNPLDYISEESKESSLGISGT